MSFSSPQANSGPLKKSDGTCDTDSAQLGNLSPIQPDINPTRPGSCLSTSRVSRSQSKWQRYQGYRFGVTLCVYMTGTVFLVNLILTIWATKIFKMNEGIGTIQSGSCQKTKNLSLWLHLLINALSTALLSASNYCMQCLSSPTRKEIDKAHARHIWLDIGVPSVRNLRRISWKRMVLWWLLAISSLPLHLMYNSVIFDTISTHSYVAFIVSKEFLTGAPYRVPQAYMGQELPSPQILLDLRDLSLNNTLERLEKRDCIKKYGGLLSKNSNVLAVSSTSNAINSILDFDSNEDVTTSSESWICKFEPKAETDGYCNIDKALNSAQPWTFRGHQIEYCLSQTVQERCTLQFSLPIILIVIMCNLGKMIGMISIVLKEKSEPLITVGDAISSFLNDPDPTTKNMCLADKDVFRKNGWRAKKSTWKPRRHRWFRAASLTRWVICNGLCIITLITASILLSKGINNPTLDSKSISHLWDLGYGAVSPESLINLYLPQNGNGLMLSILLANLPQVLLSFLYFTYNGLFSCMLLVDEWSGFARERKTLRVTSPVGKQRSSYWLQVPYIYGIPLLVLSATLHWLVSQSIFLAKIDMYDNEGKIVPSGGILTCGYSCIAIISVIILGSITVILGLLNGSRRYQEGMPLIGSCSAAISAACHPPEEDIDASLLPVLWGAVNKGPKVGHCCFTSFDASPPIKYGAYAGVKDKIGGGQ